METFWLQRFEDPGEDGEGASFRREEVVFSNGDIVLAGELTLPDGDGQGWDEVEATMRILVQQQFEALPKQMREAIPDEDAFVDSIVAEELATWRSPWFESFFEHDPRPAIVALDVPVIALYGELDTQVPAAANSTAMSEAITDSSVPSRTIATIFSANHLFQEAVTGSVNEYARLKREFAPDFAAILTEWLTDVSGV